MNVSKAQRRHIVTTRMNRENGDEIMRCNWQAEDGQREKTQKARQKQKP